MSRLIGTILPPTKPTSIPESAKWLSGQGGGTWFYIEATSHPTTFRIKRFTPEGKMDCDRLFKLAPSLPLFDIQQPFEFTHISHCCKCRIVQNNIIFVFNYTHK